jgi:hypothetical protein
LLNPKPPDPEAAFAFQAQFFRARTPRNVKQIERLPTLEAQPMQRPQTLARASAAFDFDVVTDAPARRPPAAPRPKAGEPETKPLPREAPSEAAE